MFGSGQICPKLFAWRRLWECAAAAVCDTGAELSTPALAAICRSEQLQSPPWAAPATAPGRGKGRRRRGRSVCVHISWNAKSCSLAARVLHILFHHKSQRAGCYFATCHTNSIKYSPSLFSGENNKESKKSVCTHVTLSNPLSPASIAFFFFTLPVSWFCQLCLHTVAWLLKTCPLRSLSPGVTHRVSPDSHSTLTQSAGSAGHFPSLLEGKASWSWWWTGGLVGQPCSEGRTEQEWPWLAVCVSDVLDTPSTNDIPAVQKAKTLYRSCINESECPLGALHTGPHLSSYTCVLFWASFFRCPLWKMKLICSIEPSQNVSRKISIVPPSLLP